MIDKLKLNKEFRRAYHRGKSFVSPPMVIYLFKKKYGGVKFGITVSKKLGGAVMRNRAKRLIRAAIGDCAPFIKSDCDIVIVARSAIFKHKSYELSTILKSFLISEQMWQEND